MNLQTAKKHLNKSLNKTNFFYETCISFLNQTTPPKTFITYLKKFFLNVDFLISQSNFEKIIKLSNKKVLMFSKEQNNYYIFVFYE